MTHTPGPWMIDGYNQIVDGNKQSVLVSGVAVPMVPTPESMANAALVSQAPKLAKDVAIADELYAALELCFTTFSDKYVKAKNRDAALEAAASALGRWEERDWSDYDPRHGTRSDV